MKKLLIILIAVILLFSGCVQKTENQTKTGDNLSADNIIGTVKNGDNISADYTVIVNGSIIVTTVESIAKENNLSGPINKYKPLMFTVGKGRVIKGFDEGVVGMRVGETKTMTIPPEKAFGLKDPNLIITIPVIQIIPTTITFPKIVDVPIDEFDSVFGPNHKIGDNVETPDSHINFTIQNMTNSSVYLSYNVKVGDENNRTGLKETVINIDENNITTKNEVEKNDTIKLQGVAWNSTVIDINSENITLRNNKIPDTNIRTLSGNIFVHFNDTYITVDSNKEFSGETMVYNVTIRSIN